MRTIFFFFFQVRYKYLFSTTEEPWFLLEFHNNSEHEWESNLPPQAFETNAWPTDLRGRVGFLNLKLLQESKNHSSRPSFTGNFVLNMYALNDIIISYFLRFSFKNYQSR